MKLHPDAQFTPTQERVSLLLSVYGLELTSYELADSGIENCTIIIQTTSGKYVLRVYRQHKKSDNDIQRELDFVAYLGNNGIPVALAVTTLKGDSIAYIEQNGHTWQAILMHYMTGDHSDHYSSQLLVNLATTQASMHNLAASYQTNNLPTEGLTKLQATNFVSLLQNRETLDLRRQGFISRAESYVVSLDGSLPKGLCHLDFDNGNVLSKHNAVTAVLDFDDLAFAPYVLCLAYTVWDIAYELGSDGVAWYIETYEKYRPLNLHEKSLLRPIMLFRHYMIGCIEIANNHLNDSALTKYLELERTLLNS